MFRFNSIEDERGFSATRISFEKDGVEAAHMEVVHVTPEEWNNLYGTMEQFKEAFSDLECEDEAEWISDYNRIREFFVDKPSVNYIFVEEAHRGNSYGAELYKEALKYVQSLGFEALYSDNILSEDARALLSKLEDMGLATGFQDRFKIQ